MAGHVSEAEGIGDIKSGHKRVFDLRLLVMLSSVRVQCDSYIIIYCLFAQDYSLNMEEVRELTKKFNPEVVIIESGGDNLAANFSRELADYIIYIIDVAGGDKIPRKGGPGITQSDLLVINKTDLAEAVGADLKVSIYTGIFYAMLIQCRYLSW